MHFLKHFMPNCWIILDKWTAVKLWTMSGNLLEYSKPHTYTALAHESLGKQ